MEIPQSKKEKRRIKSLNSKIRIATLELSVAEYENILRNKDARLSRLESDQLGLERFNHNLKLWAAWCREVAEGKPHLLTAGSNNCIACNMPWPCPASVQTGAKPKEEI